MKRRIFSNDDDVKDSRIRRRPPTTDLRPTPKRNKKKEWNSHHYTHSTHKWLQPRKQQPSPLYFFLPSFWNCLFEDDELARYMMETASSSSSAAEAAGVCLFLRLLLLLLLLCSCDYRVSPPTIISPPDYKWWIYYIQPPTRNPCAISIIIGPRFSLGHLSFFFFVCFLLLFEGFLLSFDNRRWWCGQRVSIVARPALPFGVCGCFFLLLLMNAHKISFFLFHRNNNDEIFFFPFHLTFWQQSRGDIFFYFCVLTVNQLVLIFFPSRAHHEIPLLVCLWCHSNPLWM